MIQAIRQRALGGMRKDLDPQDFVEGHYPDALNVRKQGFEDGQRYVVQPLNGNKYAFTLPSITAQDKVYRIYPKPNATPDLYGLYFYKETGELIGSVVTFTSGTTLIDALNNCKNAIDASVSSYCSTFLGIDYVEVVFDTINSQYKDYKIVSAYETYRFGLIYSPLKLEVIEEAYSLIDEGETYAIGSYDLMGDLFIMSANLAGTVGVISVAQRDEDGVWTLIKLLQSTELNFSLQYLIDLRVEKNGNIISLYWTDNFNVPRAAYYTQSTYVTNGFLSIYGGIYNYDNISFETQLTNSAINVRLSVGQAQSGGYLNMGNYRYSVRLYDESLVPTEWSYLSGILPVFLNSTSNGGHLIYGATLGGYAPKVNIIDVFNINKKVYRYIELAAVQYVNNSVTGYIVGRFPIVDDGLSNMRLFHTGRETGQKLLDLAELTTVRPVIKKAKNIELIDNRLVLSNIEVDYDKNLEAFAQAIKYELDRELINGLEYITDPLNPIGASEYQSPFYVANYIGYMLNETYRFGLRVKWKNGGWSKAYWIDDITFDLNTNARKSVAFSDLNLTDNLGNPYVYYVKFTNVDKSLLPLGVEIEDIEFLRAECIEEVLCTGNAVCFGSTGEYDGAFNMGGTNPPISRTEAYFYLPDYFLNKIQNINFQTGDKILCFEDPTVLYPFPSSYYVVGNQYNGVLGTSTPTEITSFDLFEETDGTGKFKIIRVQTTGGQQFPITTNGVMYVQYIRPILNKYGDIYSTTYITTGCLSDGFSTVDTTTEFKCFGGDTFTQKLILKSISYFSLIPSSVGCFYVYSQNRVNANLKSGEYNSALYPGPEIKSFANLVSALESIDYYAFTYNQQYNAKNIVQNWISYNPNLREFGKFLSRIVWSELKSNNQIKDSYRDIPLLNFKDLDLSHGEINAMLNVNGSLMTWQPRKFSLNYFSSNNMISTTDGLEILVGDSGVLARRSNELSYYGTYHKWSVVKGRTKGGKDCVYWVNTEYRKVLRFGADGTVVLSDDKNNKVLFDKLLKQLHNPDNIYFDSPVYFVGIYGVFNERFNELIYTFILDSSDEGSPFLSKTIIFNEDDNEFVSFSTHCPRIYLKYSNSYLTPSALMNNSYVYLKQESIYDNTQGDYLLWDCTFGNSGLTVIEWVNGSDLITCDTDFFILFSQFYNPYVKYFIKIDGTFYEVVSLEGTTEAKLDRKVIAASGSSDNVEFKYCVSEEGYIQMVINKDPNTSKRFIATQWATDKVPYMVEYETELHKTTQLREEFETRENFHYCTIFNDELTGQKTGDTTQLFGRWVKVKMKFKVNEYNKLYNFIVTLYNRFRQYLR